MISEGHSTKGHVLEKGVWCISLLSALTLPNLRADLAPQAFFFLPMIYQFALNFIPKAFRA